MRYLLSLAVVLAAVGVGTTAEAAKPKSKDAQITLMGCVKYVSTFCRVIKGKGGDYLVGDAVPPVPDKTFVILRGTPYAGVGICAGKALRNVTWKATKRKCPA